MRRLAAACLAIALPALGEDFPRNEVFGSAGWGTRWNDNGSSVPGVAVAAGFGRRILPQFAIEGEVSAFRGTRVFPAPAPRYRAGSVQFLGNGVLYFARSRRTLAFVLLGAGAAHATDRVSLAGSEYSRSGSGFAVNAGAGAKVFLSRHLALRPEARVVAVTAGRSASRPFAAGLSVSLGLGYHW